MERHELAALLQTTEAKLDARLIGLKVAPVCGRCGGSGRYSFNQQDGDRCYGCGGLGHVKPKNGQWNATVERAKAAADDGTLDEYLSYLRARQRCKHGMDRVFDAWSSTYVALMYGRLWRDSMEKYPDLYARNKAMADAQDSVRKAENRFLSNPRDWQVAQDFADAIDHALAVINANEYES